MANRLIIIDPNPEGKGIPNPEDFSIYVELKSIIKGKSSLNVTTTDVDIENNISNNNSSRVVGFLDGTNVGAGKRTLTTNYTEVGTNLSFGGDNDLEALGIESINISFDTAYTPMINIKFIDVRGHSILSQGNDSKYRMFFELPYPLFELTVKGFYGKAVTYCLHLTKWTSNFNSNTGNFEINADFIGYTYALLTDCLIGLMRACINTNIGSSLYSDYKSKYPSLITIDEFRLYVNEISQQFTRLKEDNKTIEQLNKLKSFKKNVERINDRIINTISELSKGGNDVLNNRISNILLSKQNNAIKDILKKFKEDNTEDITGDSGINKETEIQELKLNLKEINGVLETNLTSAEISDINVLEAKIKDKELAKKINLAYGSNNATNLILIDFTKSSKEVNRVLDEIKTREEVLNKTLTTELINITENIKVNNKFFKPTIRNIINIFVIHAQIFLQTIQKVSINAENSSDREPLIKDKLNDDLTKRLNAIPDAPIFPWPEYNVKIEEKGYYEEWLGTLFNKGEIVKIPELAFVEELLSKYMDVIRIDDKFERTGGINVDEFYPVSPLDAPVINVLMKENPYKTALKTKGTGTPDEAYRCLLMRGFLGLGVANRLNGIEHTKYMGQLEAENLFYTLLTEFDTDVRDKLMDGINSSTFTNVINNFKNGKTTLNNKKELLKEDGNSYVYSYIKSSSGISYLPINGDFNGDRLSKAKTLNDFRDIANDILFVSDGYATVQDNGSVFLKIIDEDTYTNKNNGGFNNETIGKYLKQVGDDSLIEQRTLKAATYSDDVTTQLVDGDKLNRYNGNYKTLQIDNIIYNEEGSDSDLYTEKQYSKIEGEGVGTVLSAYFYQLEEPSGYVLKHIVGTYLATYDESRNTEINIYKEKINRFIDYTNNNSVFYAPYRPPKSTNNANNNINRRIRPSDYGKTRELINNNNLYLPFVDFSISNGFNSNVNYTFSLFGSRWYYAQSKHGRAFLFLHSIPWQGVVGDVNDRYNLWTFDVSLFDTLIENTKSFQSEDDSYTIKSLFGNSGSFIKAPKLWCAFIGGLLYRYDTYIDKKEDIISFTRLINEVKEYLLPFQDEDSYIPKYNQYLYEIRDESMCGINLFFDAGDTIRNDKSDDVIYAPVDKVILNLPKQAREEFKKIFEEFVNKDFEKIQLNYELFNSVSDIEDKHNKLIKEVSIDKNVDFYNLKTSNITSTFEDKKTVYVNYLSISPLDDNKGNDWKNKSYQFDLTLNNNEANEKLVSLFNESYYIMNATPRIFRVDRGAIGSGIKVNKKVFNVYVENFFIRFKELVKEYKTKGIDPDDELQKKIFNTFDDDTIKLIIYRTLSSINAKWLGSEISGPCNTNKCADITNIVDTFKFLDTSFLDIGQQYLVNPQKVLNAIEGNYNQSLFEVINRILLENDFNFIPLPTFIDFNEGIKKEVFTPYPYTKALDCSVTGPSFVCVYTGQKSTTLNLGKNSLNKDDGIFLTIENESVKGETPEIFSVNGEKDSKQLNIPYFLVSYAKGNQSIFKNLKLDQKEFTETQESLEIIEDISQNASKGKGSFKSQNLFNVYQQRAYSVEVETMGNVMLQPMMYFQLNNIPLFRGAYLILNVSHSITANNMSTTFKGSRIKNIKTNLITEEQFYMSLLGPFGDAGSAEKISNNGLSLNTTNNSTGSPADRVPKSDITYGIVTKSVNTFDEVLLLIVNNLEGAYCKGGTACGDAGSGETLWGLDRKKHAITNFTKEFWTLVDNKDKKNPITWDKSIYPKPKDQSDLYEIYKKIIKKDYDDFKKNQFKNKDVLTIVESDGRLYLNMVYAAFNGAGWFRGFVKLLEENFDNGLTSADELLEVFVNERISGGKKAFKLGTGNELKRIFQILIANTGVDIQKMVGLGPFTS